MNPQFWNFSGKVYGFLEALLMASDRFWTPRHGTEGLC